MAIITCGKSEVGLFQGGTSYEKDIKELELNRSFLFCRKCVWEFAFISTKQKGYSPQWVHES